MQAVINPLKHEGGKCGHRARVMFLCLVFSILYPWAIVASSC